MDNHEARVADFLSDWERYPKNFFSNFAQVDLDACHQRLRKDAKRLISNATTEITFRTVLPRPQDEAGEVAEILTDVVTDDRMLDDILIKHLAAKGDHFIFLRLPHSWAPFNNSEGALRKILTAVKAHPYFLDFIHSFGHPGEGIENYLSADFESQVDFKPDKYDISGSSFEFFYNMRYVLETGRDSWPWSCRTMGVYHKRYLETPSPFSTWIILQPTATAKSLPESTSIESTIRPFAPHVSLFQSTTHSWRKYLEYLESEIRKQSKLARLDNSTEVGMQQIDFDLAFSNVQNLHYWSELIQDAITILRSNVKTLQGLGFLRKKILNLRIGPEREISCEEIQACVSRFSMQQKLVEDILDGAKQASNLIQTQLNFKHSRAIASNTTSMDRMAQASKKDGELLLGLTKATNQDSGTVKLVAVITMIYLPETFAATLFSTGFITFALQSNETSTHMAPITQALSYTAVTIGLTVTTMCAAYMWNNRIRKQEDIDN